MNAKQAKPISKYLSYILRHDPEEAGIILDENGWTNVDTLIQQVNIRFPELDKTMLEYIVATNNKQRFSFNQDKTMIRANQGHSIDVDLNLFAMEPPMVLFHGTAAKNVKAIMQEGLHKQERHHVHLSQNVTEALQVGTRHGKAIVLKVHSGKMHEDGYVFYISANNVWLTDHVPPQYIEDDF